MAALLTISYPYRTVCPVDLVIRGSVRDGNNAIL